MLTHFQRVMVAAQVYAGGAVSERQAVEIAKNLEELTRDHGGTEAARPERDVRENNEAPTPDGAASVQPSPASLTDLTTYYHREKLARTPFFPLADVEES